MHACCMHTMYARFHVCVLCCVVLGRVYVCVYGCVCVVGGGREEDGGGRWAWVHV